MSRLVHVLLVIFVLSVGWGPARDSHAQDQQTEVARDVIAAINEVRIAQGTWPLKPNATLEAMALAQAEYLLTLPSLPDGGKIHEGQQGEGPKIRAQWSPYNWPVYGRSDRIAVDEIGYAGASVSQALGFWTSSSVHRSTTYNPAYREIGVAALPHRFGYLFIVVFGGRPNVVPALADPTGTRLYLSNDAFGRASEAGMHRATQVRLFDFEGKPLQTWQPWQAVLPVPSSAGERVFVEYSDGSSQVLSEVHLNRDRVLLPGGTALVVQPAATPTLTPPVTVSAASTGTPLPSERPTTAPAVTATPVPTAASSVSVLVVYDSRSLAVINNTGRAVNLASLVLAQGTITFPVTRWRTQWLSGTLEAFPAQDCVQVYSWFDSNVPRPAGCREARSIVTIDPAEMFWLAGDFEVRQQNTVLATCRRADGRCTVPLPG